MSVYAPLCGDREQDLSTLQQMLDEASERSKVAFPMVAHYFSPLSAAEILDSVTAERQWSGVGVFQSISESGFHPIESRPESLIVVSDSFHLKPLFPKLQMNLGYIAVRLERERVQIFRGAFDGATIVRQFFPARRSPTLSDAAYAKSQLTPGSEERFTSASRRIAQMQLDRSTLRFYREVDKELRRSLVRESTPVILVGDDRLISLYKSVNRHRSALVGNIYSKDGQIPLVGEIHLSAIGMLEDMYRRQALFGAVEYRYTKSKGRAIDNLSKIAEAAASGHVKSLLIRSGAKIWGRILKKSGKVQVETQNQGFLSDDVLDDLGEMVLKHKGQVYVLKPHEMPTAEPVAAVLVPRAAV
jgi:hypothetical protein